MRVRHELDQSNNLRTTMEGDWYYLVVPTNGAEEGSHGTDSGDAERPQGSSVCLGQTLGVCP